MSLDALLAHGRRAQPEAHVPALRKTPIAVPARRADARRCEVPAAFYRLGLGRRRR